MYGSTSIRAKFLTGALAAITASGGLTLWFLSSALERQSVENLKLTAMGLSESMAVTIAPLIAFDNTADAVKPLQRLPEFTYAVIWDEGGKQLTQVNLDKPRELVPAKSTEAVIHNNVVQVTSPIIEEGKLWGYLQLGFSKPERIGAQLNRMRMMSVLVIGGLSVISLLGLGWLLQVMISRPLSRLKEGTEQLARGEYPEPLVVTGSDEFCVLQDQFNQTVSELQSSREYRESLAKDLEEMTQQARAAASRTSASSNHMTEMIQQTARHASEVRKLMQQVDQQVVSSNQVISELKESMRQIQNSSQEVRKINSTINEIASQTNILALNAAVEAARAGHAGRSFAVVAEEVRSLAQRVAAAAQETTKLIKDAENRANQGSTMGIEAVNAVNRITGTVSGMKQMIDEVDSACREQAQGIVQINQAIHQISEATERTAAQAQLLTQ